MFHPFYVKNEDGTGQWKSASNLEAGDELLTEDGKKVFVSEVRVEKLEEEITVYNLELDEVHTYYVDDGVLVHNRCKLGENMKKRDGYDPGSNYDAHHIFPQKYRKWFKLMGIDVDDADFGIWLEKHKHRSNARSYNKLWGEFFSGYGFDTNMIKDLSLVDALEYIGEIGRAW